jgi:hypothetical protein
MGVSCRTAAAWLALLLAMCPVRAGIQTFDLMLPPTEAFVHYNDGYIRAPGFIDLGRLTFTAVSESLALADDDDMETGGNTDDGGPFDKREDQPPLRRLDGGVEIGGTAVDVAIFELPSRCARSRKGCDWTELGVGKKAKDGTLRWCCSNEAIDLGMCDGEKNYGRLMIDAEKFKGNHRFVTVQPSGAMSKQIRYGKVEEKESGTYVVVYANCNEQGREIQVTGEAVWRSVHGYLPGELYGFMWFYVFLTVVYFVLLCWYGLGMYKNEEHRIEIEKWIFLAIILGLLEMVFRTGDYFVWNADGYRSQFIIWVGILTGVLKQGISRCLVVMVSLGWGVVRDDLGSTMRAIVILGAAYIVVSAVRDLMIVFALEDVNRLSTDEEAGMFDVITIMTFIVSAIDVIFIMWILDALNNTMLYLENMNQTRKLDRYLKLRCLFLFAILFAAMWAVFSLVDTFNEDSIVMEEHAWLIDAASELNYLFVLIGVAWLWKPNPNAKEYAYVMELPAIGGADNENELELTGVVPSAADSDDGMEDMEGDLPRKNGGYHDEPDGNGHDSRFEIS